MEFKMKLWKPDFCSSRRMYSKPNKADFIGKRQFYLVFTKFSFNRASSCICQIGIWNWFELRNLIL